MLSKSKRKIVIHHLFKIPDPISLLRVNDLVFFDDCLYSQYVFLKRNNRILKDMRINCVLGFSPKAVRPDGNPGVEEIESATLHSQLNDAVLVPTDVAEGDFLNGFMTFPELVELMGDDNIFIALHGGCHFRLETIHDKFKQFDMFVGDLKWGMSRFNELGLKTDIFVFPYAFQPFLGVTILKNYGFKYIFAVNDYDRIPIEELMTHEFYKYRHFKYAT